MELIKDRNYNLPYKSLSPESNAENRKNYFETIDWAINKEEIYNVAITGPYGSGKSSIIKTFFQKNRKIKDLWVSFDPLSKDILDEEAIEKSILQQLFYKVKDKKIHYTRVKKITDEGKMKTSSSLFNKYIDEIIGFFEVTNYSVIVFEDLARVNTVTNKEIFFKLKELNALLNNSEFVNRKITFIYTLRDSVFSDTLEKTKVFDFIIPITPFVSSSNSKEILVKQLEEMGINVKDEFDEKFINNISIYINDMRLLNNICNEFYIYKNNLFNPKDVQKLFAIIVYKNLYPIEFEDLQNGRGTIYNIFANKNSLIKEIIIALDSEVEELRNKLIAAKAEIMNSFEELKKCIIGELLLRIGIYDNKLVIDDKTYKIEEIMLDSFPIYSLVGTTIKSFGLGAESCKFEDLLNGKILEKMENISNKEESQKTLIQKEISKRTNKISSLEKMTIEELVDEFTIKEVIGEELDILSIYLLSNGYIDENYEDYINCFNEFSINQSDKIFVQNVNAKKESEYNYKIKSKGHVIDTLDISCFKNKSIFNYDIVDYLLDSDNFDDKKDVLFKKLTDETEESKKFIIKYLSRNSKTNIFIKTICHKWDNVWNFIYNSPEFENKSLYLEYILKYADMEDLSRIDEITSLGEYINKYPDIFERFVNKEDIEKLELIIVKMNIKISNISSKYVDLELLKFIKDNRFYEINPEMISIILNKIVNEDLININTQNYTCILRSNDEELIARIENHIERYIRNIFLKLEYNTLEIVESVAKLINNPKLNVNLKISILEKEEVTFENISKVNEKYWDLLLKTDKLKPIWRNVIEYYDKFGLTDELIGFLNRNLDIANNKIKCSDENLKKQFLKEIMCEDRINPQIIKLLGYKFLYIDFTPFSKKRSEQIIKYAKIKCTLEMYNSLRETYKDLLPILVKNNLAYVARNKKFKMDNEDILGILSSKDIYLEDKLELIQNREKDIKCQSKEDAELIANILIEMDSEYIPDLKLLIEIFKSDISTNKKLRLLTRYINELKDSEFEAILNSMGSPYNDIPTIDRNPLVKLNSALINKVEELEYVSKVSKEAGGYRIYKKKTRLHVV